jgi:N4-gp56 family major capsid protein
MSSLSGGSAGVNGGLGGGSYASANNVGAFTPSNAAGLVQKAYDRLVEFELRATPLLRSVADKKPARQAMPGSTVALQIYNDMAINKNELSELVDPSAVSIGTPDVINVELKEYGNSTLVSRKLQLMSLADVDPAVANIIAFNMADSIDELAQDALLQGKNVIYATGGSTVATTTTGMTADDVITSADVRRAVAKLRTNKANGRKGSLYWAGIHPEVSHDLRQQGGSANWRLPHEYSAAENIWAGEIGTYEGAYFVESPRLRTTINGADGTGVVVGTATGVTGGFAITASASVLAVAEVGDKVSGTGIATGALITSISDSGLVIGVSLANTATVSGNLTVTPVTKVYRTFICGQQALAEAVAEEPHVVIGPVTDRLMRSRPIGWYGVLGHAIYRNEALYRIESASSIPV